MIWQIAIAFLIGISLGIFYFGGLWLTVNKVPQLKHPFLWLWVSFLIRFLSCFLVFYFVIGLYSEKLLSALVGCFLIRFIAVNRVSNYQDLRKNREIEN